MKKYILSTLVLITFITYAFYQQITGTSSTVVVNNPTNNTTGNSSDTSNSQATAPQTNTQTTNTPVTTPVVQKPLPVATKPKPAVASTGQYKDGTYTGDSADAYYGNIQVQITVSGGKLTNVQFLDHPQDRSYSVRVNTYAMPILASEAIAAQNANVNTVSGATDSSGAFRQSLGSALLQAKNS